jgi:hypothetical protein
MRKIEDFSHSKTCSPQKKSLSGVFRAKRETARKPCELVLKQFLRDVTYYSTQTTESKRQLKPDADLHLCLIMISDFKPEI